LSPLSGHTIRDLCNLPHSRCEMVELQIPATLFPFRFPRIACLGPLISCISLRLSFSVPPANLPTVGVPTPRSRFPISLRLPLLALSSMTPFSCASFLRTSSRAVALALIPLLCDSGIFCCVKSDAFAPKACILRSVILSRFAVGVAERVGWSSR